MVSLVWLVGLAAFISTLPAPSADRPEAADAIVVYTGGGGARIIAGMSLLSNGAGERLLISGVHPATTRTNLSDLWDGDMALFDCCVDLGREARSTAGNAREAAQWAAQRNAQRIVIVTSDYHMPRALTETRAKMPDIQIAPHVVSSGLLDDEGRPLSRNAWEKLAGEYNKFLMAKVRRLGAMIGLSPA